MYFLETEHLKPTATVIDFGCGDIKHRLGAILIPFLAKAAYCGVDVRQSVFDENIEFLRSQPDLQKKTPRFVHVKNLELLSLATYYDVICAFSVVIHMTDPILAQFMQFAKNHLMPKGVLYMNVNIGPAKTRCKWKEFPVVERPLNFYVATAQKHGFTVQDLGTLASYGLSCDPASDRQHMLKLTQNL